MQIVFNGLEQKRDNFGRSHIVDQENLADAPGVLMRKVVPADNSCLFTSVGYVLNGKLNSQKKSARKFLKFELSSYTLSYGNYVTCFIYLFFFFQEKSTPVVPAL